MSEEDKLRIRIILNERPRPDEADMLDRIGRKVHSEPDVYVREPVHKVRLKQERC